MKMGWVGAMALVGSLATGSVFAEERTSVQGPLDRPAASDAPAGKVSKPPRRAHRHGAKASVAKEPSAGGIPAEGNSADASAASPTGAPTSKAQHAIATDPMDFSFKWRGNNDSAESTRVQNYNGDAAGTGAALGLNMHF